MTDENQSKSQKVSNYLIPIARYGVRYNDTQTW